MTTLQTRPPLHVAVADYLSVRGQEPVTESWVAAHAGFLGKAVAFFGEETKLGAVTVEDVVELMAWLRRQPTPQGRPYSEQSIRHHLYALSALYRKAQRLKTEGAERTVPLWPQLREVLERYLETYRHDLPGEVLFPSPHVTGDRPLTDLRDLLDRIAVRAGFLTPVLDPATGEERKTARGRPIWAGRRIRTRIFRQTYCAARLQTLDRGQPVSLYTVSRELGHESEDMVRRVYARLGKVRHRVEAPEFRPE